MPRISGTCIIFISLPLNNNAFTVNLKVTISRQQLYTLGLQFERQALIELT